MQHMQKLRQAEAARAAHSPDGSTFLRKMTPWRQLQRVMSN